MECALWLNRRKIYHADEISDNLDIASLRGYFLGGSLEEWLRDNGGEMYADRLAGLDAADPDLNGKLARIFRKNSPPVPAVSLGGAQQPVPARGAVFGLSQRHSAYGGSFGSFGSFRGSFRGGSFRHGSFINEWEWEYVLGSFKRGSFRAGSFGGSFGSHEWEWEYALGSFGKGSFRAGSFRSGSFAGGSLRLGSFRTPISVYGSGRPFGLSPKNTNGSFPAFVLSSDEYDRIMLETLRKCPLDRFGYGIHII